MSPSKRDHLRRNGSTPKGRPRAPYMCSIYRACRRMTCVACVYRRREYFVEGAILMIKAGHLYRHIVISWPRKGDCQWAVLRRSMQALGKAIKGRLGLHIRVAAIGIKDGRPHVHIIAHERVTTLILSAAKRTCPSGLRTHVSIITDPEGLLRYFFEVNFLPTFLLPDRPRGIRLLSGSRGYLSFGYPRKAAWAALKVPRGEEPTGQVNCPTDASHVTSPRALIKKGIL